MRWKATRDPRVGGDVDGEDGGELPDAPDDPAASMFETASVGVVVAAQEGAAYAAGDAMVIGCRVERDEFTSCAGHGCIPLRGFGGEAIDRRAMCQCVGVPVLFR